MKSVWPSLSTCVTLMERSLFCTVTLVLFFCAMMESRAANEVLGKPLISNEAMMKLPAVGIFSRPRTSTRVRSHIRKRMSKRVNLSRMGAIVQ